MKNAVAITKPTYTVTSNAAKAAIKPGDTIFDFRGDPCTFLYVTRGVEYNGTAKVFVQEADGFRRELYATVFDLTVVTNAPKGK